MTNSTTTAPRPPEAGPWWLAPSVGSATPWGRAEGLETIAPGLISVWTGSHGGIWVSPHLREGIEGHKRTAFYEEDCEWLKIHATYPSAFPDGCADHGPAVLKKYFPGWSPHGAAAALSLDARKETP